MLESAETLVERVAEVEKRKLERMVERFQSEPDDAKAHRQWKEIEKMVFGVDLPTLRHAAHQLAVSSAKVA